MGNEWEKSGKSGMSKQLRIQRIKFVTLVFTHCTLNIVFSVCDYYAFNNRCFRGIVYTVKY